MTAWGIALEGELLAVFLSLWDAENQLRFYKHRGNVYIVKLGRV